jgi:glyoxylase-like metal-dependent hydrolase (beta-lactamase superfamily II)
VDTGYAATAAAVRAELAKLGAGTARIIINTHGDGDHTGGNAGLGESAVIIAHPYVREQLGTYFALPAVETPGSPLVTVTNETTIHFNNEIIRLLPKPGGHTAGDIVVFFTANRTAMIGDVVLLGTFPNSDPARGGDAQRLIEVLNWLHETLPADTTFMASHGGAFTMDDLEAYIDMVQGTVAAVAAEVSKGRSLAAILENNPLTPWHQWENAGIGVSSENWTREIFASLTETHQRSICEPVTETLVEHGVETAVSRYWQLKHEQPDGWSYGENELNMLGYQLLARDRVEDAIVIFELNVEVYPRAFNTYDSLGEAYMLAGRTAEAIANYERSLELNPDNANATAMLARIREE